MQRPRRLLVLAGLLLTTTACGADQATDPIASPADDPESTTSAAPPAAVPSSTAAAGPTDSAPDDSGQSSADPDVAADRWPAPLDTLDPRSPADWVVEVIATAPHDAAAFTQGLELLDDGRLLESTGLRGLSDIRLVDPTTGLVEARQALGPEEFGEGVTVVGDIAIQLTWREQTARRWSLPDLEPLTSFAYAGEGWGLCLLGDRLAMSDGTATLQWRDPATFDLLDTVEVTRGGQPVELLNELECVDGHVLANVWKSSEVVVIAPDGPVVATIDASELVATVASDAPEREILNGVAAHPDGTFSMTGKLWPTRFSVRVTER